MQPLTWYVDRLRRMSPAELCYRAVQMSRAHASRLAPTRPTAGAGWRPAKHAPFIHLDAGVEPAAYIEQAERIIEGRFTIFDLDDCDLGCPPQWNRDPLTGRIAPLQHASALDYRDERIVGNIKYLWEPARHLHIPTLAQAFALTGEQRYFATLQLHVESWIDQCPPDQGVHWTSSLELAIRLINWSIAWQLIGGHDSAVFLDAAGKEFRDRWLRSVYLQMRAITRKLSRFSSANNHLIGETAGVWIASLTWPCWPQVRRWGERCKAILEEEVLKQNAPDGGNREQAFSYQQFVLDFAVLAGLAARAANRDFSAEYWSRCEAMIDFLASVMDCGGNVPMIGDADDGYVVRLEPLDGRGVTGDGLRPKVGSRVTGNGRRYEMPQGEAHGAVGEVGQDEQCHSLTVGRSPLPVTLSSDNYQSLIATGAVLFDRADLARKAQWFDDKSRWLLGGPGAAKFSTLLRDAPTRYTGKREFPHSGYFLLGERYETPDELKLLVDAGPLGYLSIAAHGHADALSFVLSVGGEEVLVDPGTYAYHTAPEWRRHFRGTRAHNTVMIDDKDQSDQSGNFMWSRHANARCVEFLDELPVQRFVGEHDGYGTLRDPVTHRREIEFDAKRRCFTIVDTLECRSHHTARWHWHCAEGLQPILTDSEVCMFTDRYRIRIMADQPPERVLSYRAGKPDEGGWISRRFGHKEPTTTIAWETSIEGTTVFRTYICIDQALDPVARR